VHRVGLLHKYNSRRTANQTYNLAHLYKHTRGLKHVATLYKKVVKVYYYYLLSLAVQPSADYGLLDHKVS
jgi:hypothetical protein